MDELSIFVDESGDTGDESEYYLVTLVFHHQSNDLTHSVQQYRNSLSAKRLSTPTFHLNPLMRAKHEFAGMPVEERRRILSTFRVFAQKSPYRYITLAHKKSACDWCYDKLFSRIKRSLVSAFRNHLDYFQSFDTIKIYYDNGQSLVTRTLHDAVEEALGKTAIIYKDAPPCAYMLAQIADYACGVELAALKYEAHKESQTERIFFGTRRTFKKNHLDKLRRHRLA